MYNCRLGTYGVYVPQDPRQTGDELWMIDERIIKERGTENLGDL